MFKQVVDLKALVTKEKKSDYHRDKNKRGGHFRGTVVWLQSGEQFRTK